MWEGRVWHCPGTGPKAARSSPPSAWSRSCTDPGAGVCLVVKGRCSCAYDSVPPCPGVARAPGQWHPCCWQLSRSDRLRWGPTAGNTWSAGHRRWSSACWTTRSWRPVQDSRRNSAWLNQAKRCRITQRGELKKAKREWCTVKIIFFVLPHYSFLCVCFARVRKAAHPLPRTSSPPEWPDSKCKMEISPLVSAALGRTDRIGELTFEQNNSCRVSMLGDFSLFSGWRPYW